MNVGKRLRDLRTSKELSQGDIEKRTGLVRCYVSRVENGYTAPSIETLEKWAKGLDVELYQLFFVGKGKPRALRATQYTRLEPPDKELLTLYGHMTKPHRKLLLFMARKMVSTERQT